MATPLIDGWVSVELIAIQSDQKVETVFQYGCGPDFVSPALLAEFLNNWVTPMTPLAQACLSSEVSLLQAHAKTHFASGDNTEAIYDYPPGVVGTITYEVAPGNVSLATKLITGILGRKYRGRQFWFGIPLNQINANYVGSTLLLRLGALFTRHLIGFSASGRTFTPVVVSRVGLFLNALLGFAIELYLDSQRRRLTGRGT